MLTRIWHTSSFVLLAACSLGPVSAICMGIFKAKHSKQCYVQKKGIPVKLVNEMPIYVVHKIMQLDFASPILQLNRLVTEKWVDGWDDPRLLTLAGLGRRGISAAAINSFIRGMGITRRYESNVAEKNFHKLGKGIVHLSNHGKLETRWITDPNVLWLVQVTPRAQNPCPSKWFLTYPYQENLIQFFYHFTDTTKLTFRCSDNSLIRIERLEYHIREELNNVAPRALVVLHPLKVLHNYFPNHYLFSYFC